MYKKYIEEIINLMYNDMDMSYKREREIGKEIYKVAGNNGLIKVINSIIDILNEIGYSNTNIEYIQGLKKCWKEVLN
jgi:hypothetical protein